MKGGRREEELTHPEVMEVFSSFSQLYLQGGGFLDVTRLLGLTQLSSNNIHAEAVGGEPLALCIQDLSCVLHRVGLASHTAAHTCLHKHA